MKRTASIVIDLGFGDAGKGTTVDYLARTQIEPVIVRFNGGAQAAHNVHLADGRHHTFSQFGSGMFTPGAWTFLSHYVLFDPYALTLEAAALETKGVGSPLARFFVDGAARTVTPFQKAANRLREVLRGTNRHGSVGMGIGETMADHIAFPDLTVYVDDLRTPGLLATKLARVQELKRAEFAPQFEQLRSGGLVQKELALLEDPSMSVRVANTMADIARRMTIASRSTLVRFVATHPLIFEGAQGVLIDEWHGFHPYTTWSTTTNDNANELLRELRYDGEVTRYGVVRAYSTRHGPGPFPTEDRALARTLPDTHNVHGTWQGGFRVGWLDLPLTRYALAVSGGTDSLALTHLDRFATLQKKRVVTGYRVVESTLTLRERSAIVVDTSAQTEPGTLVISSFRPKLVLEDLTYQEMLGSIVAKATPVFADTTLTGEAYAEYVSTLLSCPLAITSYGKTAADKRERCTRMALAI